MSVADRHTVLPPTRKIAQQIGCPHYFSGSVCVRGNIAPRATKSQNCQCRDCLAYKSSSLVKSRQSNPEKQQASRDANKRWRDSNKQAVAERNAAFRQSNPDYSKQHYANNRDKKLSQNKQWNKENSDRLAEMMRERRSTPEGKAELYCRNMIMRCKKAGHVKSDSVFKELGYTAAEFRAHIESLFADGMSWDKVGAQIHIDHIKPVSAFLREGVTDPAIINALSNLQPLWAADNMAKGDKWDG